MSRGEQHGFTTIELLIAMIIAGLFLITIYQLYGVTVGDSTEVRNRTNASSIAYDLLRKTKTQPQGVCTAAASVDVSLPPYSTLPTTSRAKVAFDCPYGNSVSPTRVTVTITYGTTTDQQVTYASYQAN